MSGRVDGGYESADIRPRVSEKESEDNDCQDLQRKELEKGNVTSIKKKARKEKG